MAGLRIAAAAVFGRRGVWAVAMLVMLGAPAVVADEKPSAIEISGRPVVSSHYRYLVDRSRDLVVDGVSEVRNARSSARLEVVDTRDDGILFSWTLEQVELGGEAGLDVENITSQLVAGLTGFPVIYWTDRAGSIIEITNFQRLRHTLESGTAQMLDSIEAMMREEGATQTQIDGARDLSTDIMRRIIDQPPAQLGFQLFPEASLASYSFGMSLVPGEAMIYTSSEPSPLGGPPLALAGELKAVNVDREKEQVTIVWKESFAPDAVASFMRAFAAMLEERAPEAVRADMLEQFRAVARTMTIDRHGELLVDLRDGMTISGSVRKETVLGDTRRVDLMSIRRHP